MRERRIEREGRRICREEGFVWKNASNEMEAYYLCVAFCYKELKDNGFNKRKPKAR